jgi:hypothetical protein
VTTLPVVLTAPVTVKRTWMPGVGLAKASFTVAVTAFADTDNDGTQDAGEPSDTAAKTWVIPQSTPGCKVTGGGRITASNGDKGTFGGNAMADGLSGSEEYQDHGPTQDMNVHSIDITAVVCNAAGTHASIFGTATVDGGGHSTAASASTTTASPGAPTRTGSG